MLTHRLALATAIATWTLLLVGAIVHGSDASATCADWAVCLGQIRPLLDGSAPHRLSPRLLLGEAGPLTAGFLTLTIFAIALCGSALHTGRRAHRAVPALAVCALLWAMGQALLGGLTLLMPQAALFSWAHQCVSLIFFCTLLILASLTRHTVTGRTRYSRDEVPRTSYALLLFTTALCIVQIALGTGVRHIGGGLACLDIPLCRGSLLPFADGSGIHPQLTLHAFHRLCGLLFAACLFFAAPRLRSHLRRESDALRRTLLFALPLLTLAQIGLGLLSVWSYLGLFYVTAHRGISALILGGLLLLCFKLRPAHVDSGGLVHIGGASIGIEEGGTV